MWTKIREAVPDDERVACPEMLKCESLDIHRKKPAAVASRVCKKTHDMRFSASNPP